MEGFESALRFLALEVMCGAGRSKFTATFIFVSLDNPFKAEIQTPHLPTAAKFATGAMEKPRFTHPCLKTGKCQGRLLYQSGQTKVMGMWSNTYFHHSPLTLVRAECELKLILTLEFNLRYVHSESRDKGHDSSANLS